MPRRSSRGRPTPRPVSLSPVRNPPKPGRPTPRPVSRSPVRNPPKPGRPTPRPVAHSPVSNPPKPAAPAPAPTPAPVQCGNGNRSEKRGLGIKDGLFFGIGNAIAQRIVGPSVIKHETVVSSAPAARAAGPTMNSLEGSDTCGGQSKAFQDCLNNHGSEISKCQIYMDTLSECRRNSGAALGAGQ